LTRVSGARGLVSADHAVIPVVNRSVIHGVASNVVAPLSGWDIALAAVHDWYRQG